ncbi:MAG TPA: [FeFe] hydrogenase H-cluster maturation GTPase HydF [Atribacteraceae bacterium]|nr:[FeFe] hydrogenase H-cluster maturation GTPase HydF [Atribacteraceae bacterium]
MFKTPRGNRLHIAIFGRRNTGKSSLINALTNQEIALVSDVPGTTTDPVFKTMEILPIGPVVIIDTAGLDDTGELGALRAKRSRAVFDQADLALVVTDTRQGISGFEEDILRQCRDRDIPAIMVSNKSDLWTGREIRQIESALPEGIPMIFTSALTGRGIEELKNAIIRTAPSSWDERPIIGDLLDPGDLAVLVVPIDHAAPKGRLILPQVQVLRDILDHDGQALVVKECELKQALSLLKKKPKIVVTDSQAFLKVDEDTPPDVLLTSFSILFARYKGDLATMVEGALAIERLLPGDRILLAEGCTHHRVEDDIGTVKIPRWLRQAAGGELSFEWVNGQQYPEDLSDFDLIVHCGACMRNRREMLSRISFARRSGVPIVNYGICIAHLMGILPRALAPFPEVMSRLREKRETDKQEKLMIGKAEHENV